MVRKLEYVLGSGQPLDCGSEYSYNVLGNITQIADGILGYALVTYTYDDLERLTQEKYPEPSTNDWEEIDYTYDTAGNIRSATEKTYWEGEITSSTTHTYSYDDANWLDLLTAYDGVSLTYDAIGNPLSYYNGTSYTMTWAKGRQLASVSKGSGTSATAIAYAYDMDGIRRSKTVGGVTTEFVTQSGLVARQSWSGNTIDFFYDAQQRPYAMVYKPSGGTSVTYYYLTNLQGDVIALLNSSGSVVAEYEYGAWGDIRSITDSSGAQVTSSTHIASINPLRYRGYYYDTETGFYYLQSRYYDPVIKRFISADSQIDTTLSGGLNLFAYCKNNPVNMSDCSGHWPQWLKNVVGTVVAAVVNTVKSVVSSITNIVKASSNSLPKKGEPGSSQTLPNPDGTTKQRRWYGPDGNPERDRDYNHQGNMPFPHDHSWKDGERGKEHLPPDPSYKMNWEPVIGTGLAVICTVGIIVVAVDDVTGIGVADDFLFGPFGAGVSEGLIMIFD